MKLKKLLAGATAAALAVTTMAVTSFTASAASLAEAPAGTEEVLYSVDLTSVKSTFTGEWDSGDWTQVIIGENDRATIMTDPNVYIKATMSNMGGVDTGVAPDITETDFNTLMTWGFSNYNWITGLKWYNNNEDGADFECNLIPLPTSTANNAIAYAPISDTAMYDWGGIAGNLQCGNFKGLTLNSLEVVRISAGSPAPSPTAIELAFDSTKELELEVIDASSWGVPGVTKAAQKNVTAFPAGITTGMTYGELKNTTVSLTGVEFKNFSVEGLTAENVSVSLFAKWGEGFSWTNHSSPWDLSEITGIADDDILQEFGYQVNINGDVGGINDMALGDIVKVNSQTGGDTPVTGDAIWEGNTNMGTDWSANVQIPAAKFAEIKVGDTLKYTFTSESGAQMKIASLAEGWPAIPGPNPDPEWGVINISGTSFSFVLTAADVTALKEFGMAVYGVNYTLTKVELVPNAEPKPPVDPDHTHTPAAVWTSDAAGHWHACSNCAEKIDFAAHTSDGGNITTPATETTTGIKTYKCTICNYIIRTETIPATGTGNNPDPWVPAPDVGAPIIPVGGVTNTNAPSVNGKNGWEVVSAEIIVASDGDKIVVDMNGAEKVPSTILGDIEGKDVDIVFNMGRGIKWTINGLSVTSNKTINLDVTKNTRHIPNEVVDKAEGSHKKQISLDHKGNFGCVATLSYDVGTKYNGLYANLFYYNPKTEELEFADCSLVSGGNANFMFTHASDYLITISDEPLGEFEDVSSAAGIVSDNNSIGNGLAVAVSASLAAVVLGFGIVVFKKRRHN